MTDKNINMGYLGAHWEEIKQNMQRLRELRAEQDKNMRELEFVLGLYHQLALQGKKRDDVKMWIHGQHLHGVTSGPYHRAQKAFKDAGYVFANQFSRMSGPKVILCTDLVGAELNDDSLIFFTEPIRRIK